MSGGTRSYEMARRFVAAGHRVDIVTGCRDQSVAGHAWRSYVIDGITVHELPVAYSNKMGFWRRIAAFAIFAVGAARKTAKLGGDVVFATSTPLSIALPGAYAARKLKIPMVFEVRDLWPELPIAIGALKNPLLIALARKLEAFAYSRSERVVALSPGMAAGVAQAGFPADRISVISNSCDIAQFQQPLQEPGAFRERHGLDATAPIVTYAGTIGEINGVDYLIRVADAMKRIDTTLQFLIVGDGGGRKRLLQLAEETGLLGANLRILDPVSKKEMPEVLAASTVCTSLFTDLPEMWNNSANKFFDSLAAGKPVAINYGGWKSQLLAESGAGITLDATDPEKAAGQLKQFLDTADAVEDAGKAALDLARARFDRDVLSDELLNVLSAAIFDYDRSQSGHKNTTRSYGNRQW